MRDEQTLLTITQFSKIYEINRPYFMVVARSYVRNLMVAEDLVTDTFVSLWESREKLDNNSNIPAYLLVSLKRRCLNWLRDQKIHLKKENDINTLTLRIIESSINSLEFAKFNPIYHNEIVEIVKKQLNKMPERTGSIFMANRFYEKTYIEIAKEYGLTTSQVKFELQKAIAILRKALKDYLPLLFTFLP